MEFAITGALGAAGYYFNKDGINNREKNIETKPYQGRYPNTENIYTSNIINNTQYNEYSKAINSWNKSKKPMETNVIPQEFNQKILNSQTTPLKYLDRPSHTRTQNHRDSEKDMVKKGNDIIINSLTGIPIKKSDFKHNNMVPFFGSQVKQLSILRMI